MLFNARNGPQRDAATTPASEQIEMQAVRELLFGETQRTLEARIQRLEGLIAGFQSSLDQRFRELSLRFEDMASASAAQQSLMKEVGRTFAELGQQLAGKTLRDPGGTGPHVRKPE